MSPWFWHRVRDAPRYVAGAWLDLTDRRLADELGWHRIAESEPIGVVLADGRAGVDPSGLRRIRFVCGLRVSAVPSRLRTGVPTGPRVCDACRRG